MAGSIGSVQHSIHSFAVEHEVGAGISGAASLFRYTFSDRIPRIFHIFFFMLIKFAHAFSPRFMSSLKILKSSWISFLSVVNCIILVLLDYENCTASTQKWSRSSSITMILFTIFLESHLSQILNVLLLFFPFCWHFRFYSVCVIFLIFYAKWTTVSKCLPTLRKVSRQ